MERRTITVPLHEPTRAEGAKRFLLSGFGAVVVPWHVMSLYHSASMRSLNVRPGIYCSMYPGVYRDEFGWVASK